MLKTFRFETADKKSIFVYNWIPENITKLKGIILIAHGMSEAAHRYERFAERLNKEGYVIYANDHRGHGKTAGTPEKLGVMSEKDSMHKIVEDIHQLRQIALEENPNLPVFVLGHSMGSFIMRRYVMLHGEGVSGAIIIATNGKNPMIINILSRYIINKELKKHGRDNESIKLSKMSFGNFNNAFKPNRTEFDWLSRDDKEVDKYIQDKYCGHSFSVGGFSDLLDLMQSLEKDEEIDKMPKDLPILLMAGSKDPVSNNSKGIKALANTLKKRGLKNVNVIIYQGARHEILNEINREEVMEDISKYLNKWVADEG